jgi:citrate synthase
VMFAMARTSGWVAHWLEQNLTPDAKIGRPRQIYTGSPSREYTQIASR